jgi:predicted AlkP superfamily phosphohydrolase/phosphomutase
MDVPFSRMDAACGGTQIVGWGQHEWGGRRESHPARLLARVERDFGRYPITPSVEDAWARGGADGLLHGLLQGIERRTRILNHLAVANDWEFFYGVFHEAHGAGHYLWHLSDATHPRFDVSVQGRHGDPLLQVYSALDRSLHSLMERLEDDSALMIILSHGMGPNYNGNHLVPELLARFNRSRGGSAPSVGSASSVQRVWEATVGRLPARIRREAQRLLSRHVRQWLSAKRRQHPALWRGQAAFALPGLDGFAAVRVNVQGREPAGIIRAGEDYDAYLDELRSEIEFWTVGHTGRRAVARMHLAARGAEALWLGVAPDLMLWWDKAGVIEEIRTRTLGTVQGVSGDERTGEHVMHSLVLLRHPGIAAGSQTLAGMGISDIATTLLRLAAVP